MVEYQIAHRSSREIRVGRAEETVATFRPGRLIADLQGEAGSVSYKMKLPAPWRGFRYRLEQDGRELANAAKPKVRQRIVSFDVEMPGRKLQLVSQGELALEWVLLEGGEERARFTQRSFGEHDKWTADFRSREESVGLAAFVAWLVLQARPYLA